MASKITQQLSKPNEGRKRYSISFKRKPSSAHLPSQTPKSALQDIAEETLRRPDKRDFATPITQCFGVALADLPNIPKPIIPVCLNDLLQCVGTSIVRGKAVFSVPTEWDGRTAIMRTQQSEGSKPLLDVASSDVLAQVLYTWVKELPQPLLMGDVQSVFTSRYDIRTSATAEESIYALLSQLPRLNHDTFRSIVLAFYMSVEFGCDSIESITTVFGPAFFRNNGIKDSDSVKLLRVFIEKYINFFQKKRPWEYKIGRFRDLITDDIADLPTEANTQISSLLAFNAVDNLFQNAHLMEPSYELNAAGCCVWATSNLYARALNCNLDFDTDSESEAEGSSTDDESTGSGKDRKVHKIEEEDKKKEGSKSDEEKSPEARLLKLKKGTEILENASKRVEQAKRSATPREESSSSKKPLKRSQTHSGSFEVGSPLSLKRDGKNSDGDDTKPSKNTEESKSPSKNKTLEKKKKHKRTKEL